jgi:hypothetical protein
VNFLFSQIIYAAAVGLCPAGGMYSERKVKMRRIWIVLLVLVVAMGLALSACGGSDNGNDNGTEATDPTPSPDPIPTPDPDENGNGEDDPIEDDPADFVPGPVNFSFPAGVNYSLAHDALIQSMPVGFSGTGYDFFEYTPFLTQAGNPTFTIVESPLGGRGIQVGGRGETWHALDLTLDEANLDFENNEYLIVVAGRIISPFANPNVIIGGRDNPWNWFISGEAEGGAFRLEGIISYEAMAATDGGVGQFIERGLGFRIQTDDTSIFTVDELLIVPADVDLDALDLDVNGDDDNGEEDDNGDTNGNGNGAATVVVPPRPANVVYSLRSDVAIQSMEQGSSGSGSDFIADTPYMMAAGSPTFTIGASPAGGNSLRVGGRSENWYALDLNLDYLGMNFAANDYSILIVGRIITPFANPEVIVGGRDNPWNWLLNTEASGGTFRLEGTINQAAMEATDGGVGQFMQRGFRIQTNDTSIFEIDELVITRTGPATAGQAPPPPPPPVAGNVVYSLASDAAIQGLSVGTSGSGDTVLADTPYLMAAGSPTFSIVDNPLGGNAIQVGGRGENWYALDLQALEMGMNLANNSYNFVMRGRIISPFANPTVILGGRDNPWNHLFSAEASGGNFTVQGTISAATMGATEGGLGQFAQRGFRIQTDDTSIFTVDEIIITRN